jgi:Protein of unknown function (DUF3465)
MKKILLLVVVVAALFYGSGGSKIVRQLAGSQSVTAGNSVASQSGIAEAARKAFDEHKSGIQITGDGVVSKLLSDDTDGRRHQRFILTLASGQTLLVAHNIDLAPRLESLKSGDSVAFNGVYEWNAKGGVIHWTHHDPSGQHEPGWLKHSGRTYQ